MNKQIYIFSSIVSVIASLVCIFFDWRISTGIILGTISSFLYFYLLNKFVKVSMEGNVSKGSVVFSILRIFILALPLAVAYFLPTVFNFFGAFAGVMIFRLIMIIIFFKNKEALI